MIKWNFGAGFKGKKHSEESKGKIKESNKKVYADPLKRKAISERLKGNSLGEKTWFKKGHTLTSEEKHYEWKGDKVGYGALHDWVKKKKGIAKKCCQCESNRNVQWANKSWEYKRELDDWMELCYQCHRKYDRNGGWGKATQKFNLTRYKSL